MYNLKNKNYTSMPLTQGGVGEGDTSSSSQAKIDKNFANYFLKKLKLTAIICKGLQKSKRKLE